MTATIGWWAELFTEPTPASISVTGGTPTVSATENHFIQPASAALTLTGGTPTMGDSLVSPGGASIALAGGTPSVNVGRLLTPAGASLAVSGSAPSLGTALRPSGASLSTTGGTPTVTVATPVSYDNSAGSSYQSALASGAAFTWSQTVTAGAYVIVAVYGGGNGTSVGTGATVTVGGTPLSSLGALAANNNDAPNGGWVWLFGGFSPTGGSKTVSVAITYSGGLGFYGWGASHSYTGVLTGASNYSKTAGSSAAPAGSVTSAVSHRAFGAFCAFGAFTYSGFNKTLRQTQNLSPNSPSAISGDGAGASTVAFSATLSGSTPWSFAGVDLS